MTGFGRASVEAGERRLRVEIRSVNHRGLDLKIRGTEIRQEISSLIRRAMGPYARPYVEAALEDGFSGVPIGPAEAAPAAAKYFNNRKLSIFGGSNEIQKNIISKMILGL